jgi:hypothetical protein
MIDCPVRSVTTSGDRVDFSLNGERLTTRLLLECAAVLDELYPHALGSIKSLLDPSLLRMLGNTFDGPYGLPYRIAEKLAGRDVGPLVVHALIDFALNPVVPGLHSGATGVRWFDFDPPCRFVVAAKSLLHRRSTLERDMPTSEILRSCYRQWEDDTGLRFGGVHGNLSPYSSLGEATRTPLHVTETIPNATGVYAARLLRERRESPQSISHFGLNFVGKGARRFVDPDNYWIGGNWWFFPPLRIINGAYCWPSDLLDIDQATDLLIGSTVSGALDDIVHGTGPLTTTHLPHDVFADHDELNALNEALREICKFDIRWGAFD